MYVCNACMYEMHVMYVRVSCMYACMFVRPYKHVRVSVCLCVCVKHVSEVCGVMWCHVVQRMHV